MKYRFGRALEQKLRIKVFGRAGIDLGVRPLRMTRPAWLRPSRERTALTLQRARKNEGGDKISSAEFRNREIATQYIAHRHDDKLPGESRFVEPVRLLGYSLAVSHVSALFLQVSIAVVAEARGGSLVRDGLSVSRLTL